jgi:hypothetical protein
MHPLEKIVIFLAICQVVQTLYLVAHAHVLHGISRIWYLAKMVPLVVLTIAMIALVLRVFQIIPYIGI